MPSGAAAAGSAGAARALPWEKFEEHAKVAFVENPLGSRFFFKSSTTAPLASAKKPSLCVVARVTTHRKTSTELTHHTSKYQSASSDSLARLTRLLRFAMQEVLGPMKPHGVTSPRMAPSLVGSAGLPALAPLSPVGATGGSAASGDKKKKKKKTKNKK